MQNFEARKLMLTQVLKAKGETIESFMLKRAKESGMPEEKLSELKTVLSEMPKDAMLEFIVGQPKKNFICTIAIASGFKISMKEVDPETKMKAWLKNSETDFRNILRREFLDKANAEDKNSEEFKELDRLVTSGTNDEAIEFFITMMTEEQREKMLAQVELFSIFDEVEYDQLESSDEEILVMLEKIFDDLEKKYFDALERVHSDEQLKKLDSIFGTEQDTGETEEELIEKLNKLEYKRDESDKFAIVQKVSPASRQDLEKSIREIKGRLINLQGGTLDRFGLRNRSAVELEHLTEAIQDEIDELKVNKAQTHDALKKLAEHFKAPPGLSELFAPTPNRYQLYVKKRLLPELKLNLRLKQTSVKGDTPQDRAARVSAEIQETNETITLMEQQCEAEVRKYPERAADIRRRYRRAIDAMKETT